MARVLVLVFAVLAAGAAAWLASTLVSDDTARQEVAAPAPQIPTEDVLVASRNILLGDKVDGASLRWQAWPADAVSAGFITRKGQPEARDSFAGAIARMPMLQNEPVTSSKLVKQGDANFMAARLSPGMRAISVRISPERGAGGFILPGDRVDVILTRDVRSQDSGQQAVQGQTVLTNVRVLAIDQSFSDEGQDAGGKATVGKTATLELTPRQAEALAIAQASGDIWLSLRSLADNATGAPAAAGDFLGGTQSSRNNNSVLVVRYGAASRERTGAGR